MVELIHCEKNWNLIVRCIYSLFRFATVAWFTLRAFNGETAGLVFLVFFLTEKPLCIACFPLTAFDEKIYWVYP